jgi:coproporphyrinogen III oxidase
VCVENDLGRSQCHGSAPRSVSAWFGELQARIVAAMESLEVEFAGSDTARPPGRFAIESWARTDPNGVSGGGGRMAMLRGRLFEKMGVHSSIVHGAFSAEFTEQIPGTASDPRFWAAGLSLIAHPWSPHVPTIHMNVRLVRTTKMWFGGGADLTPMLNRAERRKTQTRSLSMQRCDGHASAIPALPMQSGSANGATNISS